ncbi:hypothetical protein JOC85_003807 [Bacillus mesophilus]|uniref:Uncharacterized protein n=1 Tax=Bacillus mesophilus TaxID=1808955 RepID=A0A6M0QBJ1_9BACI|nr:CBO0543 family protein [Bacillus mesophilus]MBM7662981.1 hypothetical protein [Bacillus mesophilus]NEY73695.1 hypothetical protein [Bacillus mesophilus]
MNQKEFFKQIVENRIELFESFHEYWVLYSSFHTWEFWINLFLLIIPLLMLAVFIDRKRIFEIGFFGFAIHSIAIYIDIYGINEGLWGYPTQITSYLVSNFSLDASLLPISCMFVYQYTYKKGPIFYFSVIGLAVLFAFILKPLFVRFGLFYMSPNFTYFQLLMFYLAGLAIAVIIANIFTRYSKS